MQFGGGEGFNDTVKIDVPEGFVLESFHFNIEVTTKRESMTFVLIFIQYHSGNWSESAHPKSTALAALEKLTSPEAGS
ncbi:uncharacterized protein N7477_001557 [Penicillium maclennaniae]|uniref:uncharacterized protein n=1 Tax=Penicillium maclennaniae TaxID=1343394 RepID=UPI002541593B|nr:uncharacterized protein N7477_001557 [Penicillium maclennaniae]KAJ5681617.1 hypothetical protein N7477_001557 [Penicillium maclennaniae]